MDLRQFHPTREQIEAAAQLLRYQPFVLDDDRHTGVAYSWLYAIDPTTASSEDFFFDRRVVPHDVWNRAYDANRRLANMYDAFIARIVDICAPSGSYLDVACNTGYLPVRASMAGVRTAAGIDLTDFTRSFNILNAITGSTATFSTGVYDPRNHTFAMQNNAALQSYDVVSCSAFLCHVPDPLHFLTALARLASKAIFLWSGFVESEELSIRYNPPNKFSNAEFPNGFDDGTSISLGLLFLTMFRLGFLNREELKPAPDWLPEDWHSRRIPEYQRFRAFLFWR